MGTRSLVVGTAGHIDHGKSALVQALTGTDPDRLKEEKARGITIDLGFAHAAIGDVEVAFVDVPGHERFVRNMLAGAGGIDAVMLVVAADESVMPQTREHLAICSLLGVRHGLVALTKADLVDDDTLGLVALEVADLLSGSPFEGVPVLPVSSRTGAGLDALQRALTALPAGEPRQARTGLVRLPVDRVFTVHGFGTVVTGTLISGELAEGDRLDLLPDQRTVRVRGLQVHGRPAPRVGAPRRVAVNLGAIDHREIARGVTLATPGVVAVTRRVDLRLQLLAEARPLPHGARVRLHHGTSESFGRVSIGAVKASAEAKWTPVAAGAAEVAVPPGGMAYVRVRLERAAALTRDDLVVFRAHSPVATIGGGRVLDPEPPGGGVRRAAVFDRFRQLDRGELPAGVWLREASVRGLASEELVRRGGMAPGAAEHWIKALADDGQALLAAGRAFDVASARRIETEVLELLESFHRDHPLDEGMPREALREQVARGAAGPLFDSILQRLAGRRAVRGADRLALASHRPALSAAEESLKRRVEDAARAAGLAALDAGGLASAAAADAAALDTVTTWLLREGRLTRVDTLLVHAEALERLKRDVRERGRAQAGQGTLDVAEFKALFGLTRKHAIPLLEWLDRERVTRREGATRRIIG